MYYTQKCTKNPCNALLIVKNIRVASPGIKNLLSYCRAVATYQKTVETRLNGGHNLLPPGYNRVFIFAKKLWRRAKDLTYPYY